MKNFILTFFFLSYTIASHANMSNELRLKKLSLHIKGELPTKKEYQELSTIENNALTDYFHQKTQEYLETPEHSLKMNNRLNQLFRLKMPEHHPNEIFFTKNNSLNQLFLSLTKENASWDSLIKGKSYTFITNPQNVEITSDLAFYRALLPDNNYPQTRKGIITNSHKVLSAEKPYKMSYQFVNQDKRIAGAITTARFFERYTNSSLNKNRRRAAAIFRIFLCDDMKAEIPETNDMNYVLDFVFPETIGMTHQEVSHISESDSSHGQRKDCMSCHYKLDPLGKNFGGYANSLSPTTFKGALTYKNSEGDLIHIPTEGLGDLGEKISEQKEYKACQTQHFWNWFIGEDQHLSLETHQELINKYEQLDGRTNDFISYIVNRKEFFETKSIPADVKLALRAKKILKNCNQCHSVYDIPSFTKWPITSLRHDMGHWTSKIQDALGLSNQKRTMPPSEYPWQPTHEEIEIINQWIKKGAPNENGQPQIP